MGKISIIGIVFGFFFLSLSNAFAATIHVPADQPTIQAGINAAVKELDIMPMAFTQNNGQWPDSIKFRADADGATMWFCKDHIVYQFVRQIFDMVDNDKNTEDKSLDAPPLLAGYKALNGFSHQTDSIEQLIVTARFIGINPNVDVFGEGILDYKCNYFLGNDPSKWRTDVLNYQAIIFKTLYPGIDLKFSGMGKGHVQYEFVAAAEGDLQRVKVEYEGIKETAVDEHGRTILRTAWGDISGMVSSAAESRPNDRSVSLALGGKFEINNSGAINLESSLLSVTLGYSTFLGGGAAGYGIAVDNLGSAYVTGVAFSSDFPTVNPYNGNLNGGSDVFITKLSTTGNSLVYSTFLGGSGDERANIIRVDNGGNAYVTGWTTSADFPTVNPYDGSFNGGFDAFVARICTSGNCLSYSTYLGGSGDDEGVGIAVEYVGNAYVCGYTSSSDFPTVNPYDGSLE